jgi:hypothetical protein
MNGKVSPLESLWWSADPEQQVADTVAGAGYTADARQDWSWRLMIRLPLVVDDRLVATVKSAAVGRHSELAGPLATVMVAPWHEGPGAETLHVGPYSTEGTTLPLLYEAVGAAGYRSTGRHHEIYLSDPRRCAPERVRTILRQPVKRLA